MNMQSARAPSTTKLIVVIDDDPLVLDAMGGLLRSWGYRVVSAPSDQAARASLAQKRQMPDLIVCDYHLSEGNGIEAIERIRDANASPIPAFLISGDAAPERLREARARGYHLMHKPVDPTTLRAMVHEAFGGSLAPGVRKQ